MSSNDDIPVLHKRHRRLLQNEDDIPTLRVRRKNSLHDGNDIPILHTRKKQLQQEEVSELSRSLDNDSQRNDKNDIDSKLLPSNALLAAETNTRVPINEPAVQKNISTGSIRTSNSNRIQNRTTVTGKSARKSKHQPPRYSDPDDFPGLEVNPDSNYLFASQARATKQSKARNTLIVGSIALAAIIILGFFTYQFNDQKSSANKIADNGNINNSTLTKDNTTEESPLSNSSNTQTEPDEALQVSSPGISNNTRTESDESRELLTTSNGSNTKTEPDEALEVSSLEKNSYTKPESDETLELLTTSNGSNTKTEPDKALEVSSLENNSTTELESDEALEVLSPSNGSNTQATSDKSFKLSSLSKGRNTQTIPDDNLEVLSPLETVSEQVRILMTELNDIKGPSTGNNNSVTEQKLASTIGNKLTILANSIVVKTNKELSRQVADGLVRSVGVSVDTRALIESLVKTSSTTNEEYLHSLLLSKDIYTNEQQQQAFVFGMASAADATRQSIQGHPEFESLLEYFKDSIKHTTQNGETSVAARMTELALLLQPKDSELLELSVSMNQAR